MVREERRNWAGASRGRLLCRSLCSQLSPRVFCLSSQPLHSLHFVKKSNFLSSFSPFVSHLLIFFLSWPLILPLPSPSAPASLFSVRTKFRKFVLYSSKLPEPSLSEGLHRGFNTSPLFTYDPFEELVFYALLKLAHLLPLSIIQERYLLDAYLSTYLHN